MTKDSIGGWRAISRYAWPERGWLLFIFPLTAVSVAFTLLQPWPLKLLFDNVLSQQPLPESVAALLDLISPNHQRAVLGAIIAIGSIVIFLMHSAVTICTAWIWTTAGRRINFRLIQDLFVRLQERSVQFHRQSEVGDLMASVTKDSRCVSVMADKLLVAPLVALLSLAGMVFIMSRYDRSLTLLALMLPPAIVAGSFVLGKQLRLAVQMKRAIEGRLQALVQQTLLGLPVVQAFNQEQRAQRRFEELANAQIQTAKRTAVLTSFNTLSGGILSVAARGIVIWMGAKLILQGNLTVGAGAVFIVYFETILARTKDIAALYPNFQTLRVQAERVLEILSAKPEIQDKPGARPRRIRGSIQFEHVTTGYQNGLPVLKDVSFEVRQGETVALVSASGGGKSTLLSLIPRLADPWEGQIKIDSQDVRDIALGSLRAQVSIVFQEPFLSSWTVAENIACGSADASRNEIEAAARAAMAHDFIMDLPQAYDTLIGERGRTLSGGMRQRLAIARALLKNAPILILDEPTSALDAQTERDFLNALNPLMKGRTTFIAAHRLSTIMNADRIMVLDQGRLAEIGSHDELLRRGGCYARFWQISHSRLCSGISDMDLTHGGSSSSK